MINTIKDKISLISKPGRILLPVLFVLGILTAIAPLHVFVGIAVLAFALFVFLKPHWIVYLFVISFPVISLIPRGTYIPILKFDEILIIVGFVAWVVSPNTKVRLYFSKVDLFFGGLILAGSVLPLFGQLLRGWRADWLEVIALLKGYLIYRLILQTVTTKKRQKMLVYLLLFPFGIVLIIAILQMLNIANARLLLAQMYGGSAIYVQIADSTSRYFRATSTLGNWNALGSYAALGGLLSLALIVQASRAVNIHLLIFTFSACIGLLLLSGSSSSIMGFLVGCAVLWYYTGRRIKISRLIMYLLPVAFVGLVVFFLAGQRVLQIQLERQTSPQTLYFQPTGEYVETHGFPASLVIRGFLAKYLFDIMEADRIALLTGFGTSQNAKDLLSWGTAESGYMSMLFYNGPLYIILYFLLLAQIYIYARKIKRRLPPDYALGYALTTATVCSVVAMAVMNIVSSYYTAAGTSHFFWILIASTMAIMRFKDVTRQQSSIAERVAADPT